MLSERANRNISKGLLALGISGFAGAGVEVYNAYSDYKESIALAQQYGETGNYENYIKSLERSDEIMVHTMGANILYGVGIGTLWAREKVEDKLASSNKRKIKA